MSARSLLAVAASFALLAGCARSVSIDVLVRVHPTSTPDSDSLDVAMASGTDTLRMAGGRIGERNLRYRSSATGDTITMRLWYPVGADTSRLVVLVPGYRMSTLFLFALALETTNRGYPTAMLSPRGTGGFNEHLEESYGLRESDDLIDGINAYQERHGVRDLRVGLFGVSLGGAIALDVATKDRRVAAVAGEGVIDSLESSAQRMMSSEEIEQVRATLGNRSEDFAHLSPERSLRELRPMPILMRWGSKDNLVTEEERARLSALLRERFPDSDVATIEGGWHVLRYGFPLSETEARAVNRTIADFLDRSLRR